jgi:hypothetical protein
MVTALGVGGIVGVETALPVRRPLAPAMDLNGSFELLVVKSQFVYRYAELILATEFHIGDGLTYLREASRDKKKLY